MPDPLKKSTGRLPDLAGLGPEDDVISFAGPHEGDRLDVVSWHGNLYIGSFRVDRITAAAIWNAIGHWLNTGRLKNG